MIRKRRFRALAAVPASLFLIALAAQARMWTDPGYEKMIRESELIVRARVETGGSDFARVDVLEVFHGDVQGKQLAVGGFNNPHWPAHARRIESFETGQEYVLFLVRFYKPNLDNLLRGVDETTRALVESAPLYRVWTPSAGEVPIENGRALTCLMNTGYPRQKHGLPVAVYLDFLRASVAHLHGGEAKTGYLEQRLASLDGEQGEDGLPPHFHLKALALCGQKTYDPRFEKAAASEDESTRFATAGLLGRVPGEQSTALLETLAGDKNALVQGEAVRSLVALDSRESAPTLLGLLPQAGEGAAGPSGLMDPRRNVVLGGKLEIIRALGVFRYKPAESALLPLLETGNERVFDVVLEALRQMGSEGLVDHFRKTLRAEKKTGLRNVLEAIEEHDLTVMKEELEAFLVRETSLSQKGAVASTLADIGDARSGEALVDEFRRSTRSTRTGDETREYWEDLLEALGSLKADAPGAEEAFLGAFYLWTGVHPVMARDEAVFEKKVALEKALVEKVPGAIPGDEPLAFDEKHMPVAVCYFPGLSASFLHHGGVFTQGVEELGEPVLRVRIRLNATEKIGLDPPYLARVRSRIAEALGVEAEGIHLAIRAFRNWHKCPSVGRWPALRLDRDFLRAIRRFVQARGGPRAADAVEAMLRGAYRNRQGDSYVERRLREAIEIARKRTPDGDDASGED